MAIVLFGSLLVAGPGCGTALKRGFKEFKGAGSKAAEVPGIRSGGFAQYKGVTIGQPRSDLGRLVDSKFTVALPGAMRKALTTGEKPLFRGGSPTLTIDPEITWYHESGGLGGILGSDSFAVALFWLSDGGTPLGKVQVVTKSGASRTGEADMAKSMAKGLARWFKKQRGKND